ncbi:Arginine biosynthesis bifunctional protein ArgJ [Porphyridium purpureum]|uniref:Arginine biosynthesis bifunctional protein ArgJ, mitochondrial n=1 Tax=Porphyridium purpureum TaxID=35688 RepID=A0A5J4Z7M9_PORPP|nr:Arginine biosynthesis bifunctional protein ArgJ [Porphyridium purpureum]|eukprot:POR4099..scf295_1
MTRIDQKPEVGTARLLTRQLQVCERNCDKGAGGALVEAAMTMVCFGLSGLAGDAHLLQFTASAKAVDRACVNVARSRACVRSRALWKTVPCSAERARTRVISMAETRFTKIENGGVTSARGFLCAGMCAGLKPSKKDDVAIILVDPSLPPAAAAGVFTQSVVRAAPVDIDREQLVKSKNRARAVVINSGQANAATGDKGWQDALETIATVVKILGEQDSSLVLVSSTGVIGRRIKMPELLAALPALVSAADTSTEAGLRTARAIMTTDLVPKAIAFETTVDGKRVVVGGMAKGSGMIHPNMATMLSYITCDVAVDGDAWQGMVARAASKSFNQITVDGDTSTNDTLIGLASGASGASIQPGTPEFETIEAMVTECCQYLSMSIARDGEGATVLLEVFVEGAESDADARKIAKTVCGSHLFKAAVFGRDPNWGRIAGAAGRAGVNFDQTKLEISIGPYALLVNGQPTDFVAKDVSQYMADAAKAEYLSGNDTVAIRIKVGSGPGSGYAWGCDLSYDYVKINAEYTT